MKNLSFFSSPSEEGKEREYQQVLGDKNAEKFVALFCEVLTRKKSKLRSSGFAHFKSGYKF